MHKNLILFSIIFLMLFGCANMQRHVVEQDNNGKSMLVVACFQDDFILRKDGITIFETKRKEIDVSSWSVEKYIENLVINQLNEHYKTKVRTNKDTHSAVTTSSRPT